MKLIRSQIHQLYHRFIIRDDLYRLIRLYRETQYWPYEKLLEFQRTKLQKLLQHTYQSVPYYKIILDNLGVNINEVTAAQNFQKIPFLTKDIIRENLPDLLSTTFDKKYIKSNSTSGSTGSNLKFFSDKKHLDAQAILFRNHDWMGIDYFDKKVTIWGAPWDVKKTNQVIPSIKSKIKGSITLSGYELSDKMMMEYHEVLQKYKPKLLRSYPSILYSLALFFENNKLRYKPIAIESAGEKLHPFQREKIELVFQTKVFDFYGARDIPLIAQECEEHNGLHIMMENVLLEVIDDEGNPINEGEGDLVMTHLNNFAMPFIRYKIGDRARISKRICSCGRNLPLLEKVIGRSFDIIEFPNGNKVGGSFWTLVMRSVPGIKNFQVIQKSKTEVLINYTADGQMKNEDLAIIEKNILKYSGSSLKIKFAEVASIPVTKGGKFQFVISNVKQS